MSADSLLAEALARVEHKLDLLLSQQSVFWRSMEYPQSCPVCRRQVEYQIDLTAQVVKRVCGCGTGKLPPLEPLFVPQGAPDGRESRRYPGPAEPPVPEDRDRRQGGGPGPGDVHR